MILWLHPVVMVVAVAGGAWALSLGLRMRGARARRQKRPKAWWHQHLRLARLSLWLGLGGLALGPLAWVALRGEALLSSLHGKVGLATAVTAALTGFLGRQLRQGRVARRDVHALVGVLTVLGALVALLTGLELLP